LFGPVVNLKGFVRLRLFFTSRALDNIPAPSGQDYHQGGAKNKLHFQALWRYLTRYELTGSRERIFFSLNWLIPGFFPSL
jgi:hypothetical protein